jgi:hypothetical protein
LQVAIYSGYFCFPNRVIAFNVCIRLYPENTGGYADGKSEDVGRSTKHLSGRIERVKKYKSILRIMNSKLTTIVLSVLLLASLAYAVYTSSQLVTVTHEVEVWKDKYEEALMDMGDAFKRLEVKETELEAALVEAEKERIRAEEALVELQKQKGRR